MIYGDPFKFALQFDVVEAWNVPGNVWKNGVFALYIDGVRLFDVLEPVELRTTFGFFKALPFATNALGNACVTATSVFDNAYAYFMGDGDELMDGVVSLTCTAMSDAGLNLYVMTSRAGDRLVWSSDYGVTVSECMLCAGAVTEVVGSMPAIL